MYVCMCIYIYIYIHTYVYIYIYITLLIITITLLIMIIINIVLLPAGLVRAQSLEWRGDDTFETLIELKFLDSSLSSSSSY